VLILAYHRVIPREELSRTFVQPGMYVTPETLEQHLRFLTTHFTLLSFEHLLRAWEHDDWDRSARYCTITFDDGWLDNYVFAYPLLRAYGAPSTIFLPTDLIGTDQWLWSDRLGHLLQRQGAGARAGWLRDALAPMTARYRSLAAVRSQGPAHAAIDSLIEVVKQLPDEGRDELLQRVGEALGAQAPAGRCFLNWNEVREMSEHGVAFGSHTGTHAILTMVDRDTLRRELRRPLAAFREERVNAVPVISYPNGDQTDVVAAEARAAGYRAGVTTAEGFETGRSPDLLRLKRISLHDDVSRSIPLLIFQIARQARRSGGREQPRRVA
jgi:peptidoglycan/xylan/chitin deacetylase (PgdA/CDA1 family)